MRENTMYQFRDQEFHIPGHCGWRPYDATVQGATPLARAQVVKQDEKLEAGKKGRRRLVNSKLPSQQYTKLKKLTEQFYTVFAKNHRSPSRTMLSA